MTDNTFLDPDIEEILSQEYHCHRCKAEGIDQELETVYYVEELKSHRLSYDKYRAVAENDCPVEKHSEVGFTITEAFYSQG